MPNKPNANFKTTRPKNTQTAPQNQPQEQVNSIFVNRKLTDSEALELEASLSESWDSVLVWFDALPNHYTLTLKLSSDGNGYAGYLRSTGIGQPNDGFTLTAFGSTRTDVLAALWYKDTALLLGNWKMEHEKPKARFG